MSFTGVLFMIAFLAGCLMALVRSPIYGLLTYVGAFYLHPPSRWWGAGILHDIRWSLIAAAVTALALLLRRERTRGTPFLRQGVVWGIISFYCWILLQSIWAIDATQQALLVEYYFKFFVTLFLIYKCVDSERNLQLFMWSHVLGCFYFGWIAYTSYTGGRFEDFGGPGLSEANAAALTMVTGTLFAASLFLGGNWRKKGILAGLVTFIVNGIVTTISRSGFLAMAIGGVVYNFFAPARFSRRVRQLSVVALVLFALLTNPLYWVRIQSIKYQGEQVEGVDTGGGRLEIMAAQLQMFQAHPFGCGHMCTEILSPAYMDPMFLSAGEGRRSSHNTFMSLLVDQGVVGGLFYALMLLWILISLRSLARKFRGSQSTLATLFPAIAGALIAMSVGDMFVPYVRYEVRFWFIGVLLAMHQLVQRERETLSTSNSSAVGTTTLPLVRLERSR